MFYAFLIKMLCNYFLSLCLQFEGMFVSLFEFGAFDLTVMHHELSCNFYQLVCPIILLIVLIGRLKLKEFLNFQF